MILTGLVFRDVGQPRFFLFPGNAGMLFPTPQGVQAPPFPVPQGQQRSGTERVASPGKGAVQRVWDASQQAETAVSGNAGNRCFESLYIQRHCLLLLYRKLFYTEISMES